MSWTHLNVNIYKPVDFTDQSETQYLSDPSDLPPGFETSDEPSPETGEMSSELEILKRF